MKLVENSPVLRGVRHHVQVSKMPSSVPPLPLSQRLLPLNFPVEGLRAPEPELDPLSTCNKCFQNTNGDTDGAQRCVLPAVTVMLDVRGWILMIQNKFLFIVVRLSGRSINQAKRDVRTKNTTCKIGFDTAENIRFGFEVLRTYRNNSHFVC